MKELLETFRRHRNTTPLIRGDLPKVEFEARLLLQGIIVFIVSLLVPFLILKNVFGFGSGALIFSYFFAIVCTALITAWPLFVILALKHLSGAKQKSDILKRFDPSYAWLEKYLYHYELIEGSYEDREKPLQLTQHKTQFSLWLGTSTGLLSSLWHRTGLAPNQAVSLGLSDACQNILVLGGIGSGKTTSVMQPLLLQCLDQNAGGLIFDIKGDVKKAVTYLAELTHRKLFILGPGHLPINLLQGLTPEVSASFLKSVFLLNGKGRSDSFWVDTATELCRNTLGMLSFFKNHYNLQSLYQYLFELDYQEAIDKEINRIKESLGEKERRLLNNYCQYQELIFSHFDAKIKSGVLATVAQALAPFKHPDLLDAFCSEENDLTQMEHILEGVVYLIDLPLARFGLGAKVAYTFLKLRFFNLMQNRYHYSKYDNTQAVFFMCDEFQEIVSANQEGLSDLNFWDKSRSSNTIGIISAQSMASFYAALGDHDMAHALLQNFRQKLCLRTEDPLTLEYIERLIGNARVKKKSKTEAEQRTSVTISESRESVVDAQLFRELKQGEALAILSIEGHSMDDVLNLTPVFIE